MEKIGRNDPCSCGSGKKFKKCCESQMHNRIHKKSLGSAQILSGANKMSSFFQRHVTPITSPKPPENPATQASQEVSQEALGSATL